MFKQPRCLVSLKHAKTWLAIPLFKKAVIVKADYHQANHSLGTCYKKLIGTSDYINSALQYIKPDTATTAPFNSTIPQSVFESASYAKMIYEMIIKTLQTKGNAVIDVTAHQSIINEIKVSCNQFLILENSYLKSSFNFETELYQPLLKRYPFLLLIPISKRLTLSTKVSITSLVYFMQILLLISCILRPIKTQTCCFMH